MNQTYFFYRDKGRLKKVILANIQYLKSDNNHTLIYEDGGYHEVRIPLKTAVEQLNCIKVVHVHKSYAVVMDKIDLITKYYICLAFDPQLEIPVSKSFLPNLVKQLEILGPSVIFGGKPEPDEED